MITAKEARDYMRRNRGDYQEISDKIKMAAVEGKGCVHLVGYDLTDELISLLKHDGFNVFQKEVHWA